jgi:hypothetical protein
MKVIVGAIVPMTAFESKLRDLIPKVMRDFRKLETGEPYHFDQWADDRSGSTGLYYWFYSHDRDKRNKKRVIVSEIQEAFGDYVNTGSFDRHAYRKVCPVSATSAPCGFVVVGRIFEALDGAVYSGREKGFLKPT